MIERVSDQTKHFQRMFDNACDALVTTYAINKGTTYVSKVVVLFATRETARARAVRIRRRGGEMRAEKCVTRGVSE